jgi:tetratricopeptide (TPR) repeat protein
MHWLLAGSFLFLSGLTPQQVEAKKWLKDADALLARERPTEAVAAYDEAIRLDPVLMMAYYGLGQAQMDLKKYPAAIEAFRGARDAFYKRLEEGYSGQRESDRERDKRINQLRDRIRDGVPAGRRQNAELSVMELEVALLQRSTTGGTAKAPEVPAGISLALGSAYFRAGQLDQAEIEYRAALKARPKLGEAHNNLAVVMLLTARPAEAREQVEAARKSGFQVAPGLVQDIETAAAGASVKP